MYSGKVISYKLIVNKLFRDFPFDDRINDEECLEWLAEFMSHTNSGVVMEAKVGYIDVCDGRGDLPFDLHKIKQCAQLLGIENAEQAECGEGTIVPMRWSTDNFHSRYHSDSRDYTSSSGATYTVGQGFVFPSFSCGVIALSYEAIPTDCEGYPTIPAEQQWVEAATHYIAQKIAKKMFLRGEMTENKFELIEKDRNWYFSQAVNHSKQWNGVDEAESFKNQMVRTIPSINDHKNFFANMQIPEQRYFNGATNTTSSFGGSISNNTVSGLQSNANTSQVNYLPILITGAAGTITNSGATCINNLTSYGNTPITNYGIVYSIGSMPDTSDSVMSLGAITSPGSFTTVLSGLLANTTYHVRTFATHSTGTSYGNEITFTTLP